MGSLPVIKDNIQILKYFKKLILVTQNQNMQKSLPLPFCHKVEKTPVRKWGEYPCRILGSSQCQKYMHSAN